MTALTPEEIAVLREKERKATPAPWALGRPGGPQGPFWMILNGEKGWIVAPQIDGEGNAAFITELRNAAPALLDTVDAQAEQIRVLREALIGERHSHRWHIVMIPPESPNFVPHYVMEERWPAIDRARAVIGADAGGGA